MKFEILDVLPSQFNINTIYLIKDNWDDWFKFNTQYFLFFIDKESNKYDIGNVKIGQFDMEEEQSRASIDSTFESLNERFFSIGQSADYYDRLNSLDDEVGNQILVALKDFSYDLELFEVACKEEVTRISLLREISSSEVREQFHRIAHGGLKLIPYNFKFIPPKPKGSDTHIELDFQVQPSSNPSSNVHVLIGRNGVGKTHLLNNMLDTLFSSEKTKKHGLFISEEENIFSNIVSVSFSAFDESEPKKEQKDKTKGLKYSYIGLKRSDQNDGKDSPPKSPTILKNEFVKSLKNCQLGSRKERWINAIKILESDPMFKESEVFKLISLKDDELKIESSIIFKKLSSGHKIVLLSITRLVETIEEKTFVMLDEPESHLHPPLLSAFIRALSDLLILRNGVAIIATHSPVILQEVPKNCVWILNRSGITSKAERPERETFGENVGVLTHEVFGLEVTNAGFYNLVKKSVDKNPDYKAVREDFSNKLGMEAKAIARTLMNIKENTI